MNDTRPDWRSYWLTIAQAVSVRADCTRRQVGCVLVDERNRLLSSGYNGAISGAPGCLTAGACPRGQRSFEDVPAFSSYTSGPGRCIATHAEGNAVQDALERGVDVVGATAYVNHEPCSDCRTVLWGVGVARVVWPLGDLTL